VEGFCPFVVSARTNKRHHHLFASVFLCFFPPLSLKGWINFFSLPDGLRHLFGDHNPSSMLICCVIYDLEGSNDAYPQDANLTLVGEIYFP
jgi:hypothetical protein